MTDEYKEALKRAQESSKELVTKPVVVPDYDRFREEDLEVDEAVPAIIEKLGAEEITAVDLTPDEKFAVIRHLRENEGLTQDAIAQRLGVTRRTVINYCNKIKKFQAQELMDTNVWELGGMLYQKSLKAMDEALSKGRYQQFAYVMSTMISTLQSMGLIFKMPKQSQSMIDQTISDRRDKKGAAGFQKLVNMAEKEEINLDNVFNELMAAVKEGKIDEKKD